MERRTRSGVMPQHKTRDKDRINSKILNSRKEYSEINKAFVPSRRKIVNNESMYSHFLSLFDTTGIRAKRANLT